ncbi:MAG: EAL domain-containing protein [Mycobacteriales bacterium]
METDTAVRPDDPGTQVQQRLVRAVQAAEQQARRRVECLHEVVFEVGPDRCIAFLNPAWSELLGWSVAESLGRRLTDFCLEDDVEALRLGSVGDRPLRFRHRSGELRWLQLRIGADDGGSLLAGALLDVTDRVRVEDRLAHLRRHDALTGLANRDAFLEHLSAVLTGRRGGAGSVLVVDLDDFGSRNVQLGPQRGDRVLCEVAGRLERLAPTGRVARLAGDSFALLDEQACDGQAAADLAARIAGALLAPLRLEDDAVALTASIGAVVLDDSVQAADAALAEAEAAQRRASRQGVGRFLLFAPHMRAESQARVEYEDALQRALDEQQFRLVYQPKVSLQDHRLIGVEALLRWDLPAGGVVPPAEFVSVAEQTGLIVPIGAWVLQEALRQAAQWQAAFPGQPPLEMSVNVSARQFDRSLAETVRTALHAQGVDPATVWLEVTESVVMVDVDAAVDVLRSLKVLGVNITVDDFGTGYSSLAYLRRLPLDGLKIDRSFVDGLGRDSGDTAIVAAVVGMAHALELSVVAEGIETSEQLSALRNLGCETGQGYYYARPQPPEFVAELLGTAARTGAPPTLLPAGAAAVSRADVVLVVDDTADIRQLVRMSLTTGGFEVYEAADGSAALEIARRVRPDCVVLDVHMPQLSGFQVCRALRDDPATADCTILMLTGTDRSSDKIEAFSAGADDYLLKPFAPRDLLARTRNALRRRREVQR